MVPAVCSIMLSSSPALYARLPLLEQFIPLPLVEAGTSPQRSRTPASRAGLGLPAAIAPRSG